MFLRKDAQGRKTEVLRMVMNRSRSLYNALTLALLMRKLNFRQKGTEGCLCEPLQQSTGNMRHKGISILHYKDIHKTALSLATLFLYLTSSRSIMYCTELRYHFIIALGGEVVE